MVRARRVLSVALLSCLALAGCDSQTSYVISAVVGELRLLSSVQPIQQAINDHRLDEEQQAKLAFVVRARDYAEGVIGLKVGTSYQTFANLYGGSLAWNLSASRKDALDPYIWTFPLVGPLPYIGYFRLDQAQAERDRLLGLDYDTLIYEVDAYSTIGQLPDPVTSALLERDLDSLADTVFHELAHNTVYSSDTTFNESMAAFVGRTAAMEFLAHEFGPDAPEIEQARLGYEDSDRFQEFLKWMRDGLSPIYNSELSYDEKLTQREAFFEAARQRFASDVLPLMHDQATYQAYTTFKYNNAFLLVHVRYNSDQSLFAAVHDATGHNWAETLRIFAEAAGTANPSAYLREVVPQ